jgi:AraC family transcriptional regulator, transcriptional activator of pobA
MKKIHVLSISQFNESDFGKEFYVNTIENHLKHTHLHIDRPHKHDFYVTLIFTKGTGVHEIDFESYEIKPGSMFFLNPGQVHNWKLSDDISGYIFFHTQAFFEQDFSRNYIQNFPFFYYDKSSPVLYLNTEKINFICALFISMLNESKENQIYKIEKILTLIQFLYIECAREYVGNSKNIENTQHAYTRQFKDFQQLVEKHYKTQKSAAFYANLLNISPKHLNRICQSVVGKTTTDYITERVLLEAKREIIYQKYSLTEIAYHLGYEDYAYFSRIFKKHFNETPSDFINKYR